MSKAKLYNWLIRSLMPNSKQADALYNKAIELIASGKLTSKDQIINYLYHK